MTLADIRNALVELRGRSPCSDQERALLELAQLIEQGVSYETLKDAILPAKPGVCQVEHDHWEGPMICGNRLPCVEHGGRR